MLLPFFQTVRGTVFPSEFDLNTEAVVLLSHGMPSQKTTFRLFSDFLASQILPRS